MGGAGCGKSTTAAAIFSLLKMHDVECELVSEFAKDLVWEERSNILFGNQEYIFGEQYRRLWRVNGKVEYAIMECPLLLGVVYGNHYKLIDKQYADSMVTILNRFDNVNIFLRRNTNYNPNGRLHTEEEAKNIDELIIQTLLDYNMPYKEIQCNTKGLNLLLEMILEKKSKFKIGETKWLVE